MYTNSGMALAIDEYVHSAAYRTVLKLRYLDGHTYEKIAEEVDMSPRQISNIIRKYGSEVLARLDI